MTDQTIRQETLLTSAATLHMERENELLSLRTEIADLREIARAAAYVRGPADCAEDRDCEEYYTEDGDDKPEVKWCSHVEHKYATFDDVRRWEILEFLVQEIAGLAERARKTPDAEAGTLAQDVLDAIAYRAALAADLNLRFTNG